MGKFYYLMSHPFLTISSQHQAVFLLLYVLLHILLRVPRGCLYANYVHISYVHVLNIHSTFSKWKNSLLLSSNPLSLQIFNYLFLGPVLLLPSPPPATPPPPHSLPQTKGLSPSRPSQTSMVASLKTTYRGGR